MREERSESSRLVPGCWPGLARTLILWGACPPKEAGGHRLHLPTSRRRPPGPQTPRRCPEGDVQRIPAADLSLPRAASLHLWRLFCFGETGRRLGAGRRGCEKALTRVAAWRGAHQACPAVPRVCAPGGAERGCDRRPFSVSAEPSPSGPQPAATPPAEDVNSDDSEEIVVAPPLPTKNIASPP